MLQLSQSSRTRLISCFRESTSLPELSRLPSPNKSLRHNPKTCKTVPAHVDNAPRCPVWNKCANELFEVSPRPVAMSMGSLASWSCNFVIGMAFPSLSRAWGAFVFLPFSLTCTLLFLLTKFYLPETRGRDPSEVAPLVAKGFRSKIVVVSN
uniref:Major facilitator superfamily (MFS) profile domain-containing protein n=1 Tax=Glossina pallidipes TaxID=7398 RepID=A0A1A9ZCB0_GLOPL